MLWYNKSYDNFVDDLVMILFSDFDWTLSFVEDEAKTQANIEAVKEWRERGHQFCITTGRSYVSVTRKNPQIAGLCDYYIVDGGSILLSESGSIIEVFQFTPRIVLEITEFSKHLPEIPIPFYYTPDSEGIPLKTENITKFRLFFKNVDLLDGAAELLEKNFPVSAFTCEAASSHKELAGQNGFVEIIPRELGKSHAIDVLRRRENIPLEDIVTVGDGPNDYEMVRDYNGYAIKGSKLNSLHHQLKTTDSVKSLVEQLLDA